MKRLLIFFIIIAGSIQGHNPNHLKYLMVHGNCPNCDLTNAFLQGIKFAHANFDGANLSGANLSGAFLEHASFKNAKLIGTILNQSILNNAKFNNADMTNAQVVNANLTKADLSDTILKNTNFFYARLIEAVVQRAKFDNTVIKRTDLYKANLSGSTGNLIVAQCPGSCTGDYCSYMCTNFCCTTMPDGSLKTDPNSQLCHWNRRKSCSLY